MLGRLLGKTGPDTEFEKVEIKWSRNALFLAQIYSSGLEYAFCSPTNEQCHSFVYCKDFLQDAVHAFLNGGTASIFGFTYSPAKNPALSMDRTRIILVNKSDPKFAEKIPNVLDFINQFSKRLKLKPTKVYQCSNSPRKYANGAFLFEASGMWMNAPVLISMYSLFLRAGFAHKIGTDPIKTIEQIISGKMGGYGSNDRTQLAGAKKGIDKILEHGYRKFFYIDTKRNYPAELNVGTMHGSTGIVAFANGTRVVPYWTRKNLERKPKVEGEQKTEEPTKDQKTRIEEAILKVKQNLVGK